jgi:nucleotide-binding universal stress UspA family protein
VIATRGLTGLKSLALGSTAEYVVRRCPCPVLTIHPDDEIIQGPLERILLPTDLSGDSMRAAEVFVALFGPWERPEVTLLYADRTPPYMDPFRHDILARLGKPDPVKDKIEAQMEPFEKLLRAADFEVRTVVADGDPVNATADYAERENMDLVLIATHGRSALANLFMGRTAQRIVQSAPCPVLSVPTRSR